MIGIEHYIILLYQAGHPITEDHRNLTIQAIMSADIFKHLNKEQETVLKNDHDDCDGPLGVTSCALDDGEMPNPIKSVEGFIEKTERIFKEILHYVVLFV